MIMRFSLFIMLTVGVICTANAATKSENLLKNGNWVVEFQNVGDGSNYGCILTTFNDSATNFIVLWSRNMPPVINIVSPVWDLGKGKKNIILSVDGKALQARASVNKHVAGLNPDKRMFNSLIRLLKQGKNLEAILGNHREKFSLRGSRRAIGVAQRCAEKINSQPPLS